MAQSDAYERESGIVILNLALQPIGSDRGAWSILRNYDGGADVKLRVVSVPPEVVSAISSRRPTDQSPGKVSVWIESRRYWCRFYMVHTDHGATGPAFVAVHFESDSSHGDESIRQIAAAYKLTKREEETLEGIALGLSTKELAERMQISPNTVKSFVRLIMIKMGVASRNAIMVKLLETRGAE